MSERDGGSKLPHGALLLIAVATLLFADVLFLGNNFYLRDLFQYHFPLKRIVRDTIAGGEFPWWQRRISGGQPMAANPAYEIFYPPQWLILVGPFAFGFALHIVFHVYVALLGMYAFLRSLALRVEAAIFGAFSFGLSGFLLGTVTNLPTFFVWSWAGVVGWAVLRAVRTGRIGAAAIAIAMPLLVGEPMALAQMLLLIASGTLWLLWGPAASPDARRAEAPAATLDRRAAARVAGAMLLAVAIAAVQIVPAIDHARDSSRSRGFRYDVATDFSMPPARPLELFNPRLFGVLTPEAHAYWGVHLFRRGSPYLPSLYCGFAVAILALAGLLTRQRGWPLVLSLCAASYVLAIGDQTPLFRWLYDAGLRSIRYPEKFAAMGLVVTIVFAAFVCDRLLSGDRLVRRTAVEIAGAMAVLLLIGASICTPALFTSFWRLPSRAAPLASAARQTLFVAAVMAALWGMVIWRIRASRVWMFTAFALLLFDLGSFSNEALPRMPREFFTTPSIARSLEGVVFHRGEWTQGALAAQYASLSPGWTARNGLRPFSAASWGVRSVLEADFDETDLLPTHDLLDAMIRLGNSGFPQWSETFAELSNVRTILDYRAFRTAFQEAQGDPARLQPLVIHRLASHGTYFFPRALLPLDVVRVHTPESAFVPFPPFTPAPARVIAVRETSNRATIDVDASGRAFLVATVTRHKYWRATIDGRPAQLLPANFAYQGLEVPAGRHRIEMRYRNPLVIWGGAVSALALIALIPRRLRPRSEP